jgi:hypothetical protein
MSDNPNRFLLPGYEQSHPNALLQTTARRRPKRRQIVRVVESNVGKSPSSHCPTNSQNAKRHDPDSTWTRFCERPKLAPRQRRAILHDALVEQSGRTKKKKGLPPPIPRATPEESDFRHSHWQLKRERIGAVMELAHFPPARLERFRNCGAYARILVRRDTGDHRLRASYCHDRFCQPCAAARTLQISDNLRDRLQTNAGEYKHVVLTLVHQDKPLAPQLDRLYACFKTLRNAPLWKQHFTGGIYFFQTHISDNDGLWHAHLHVVAQGAYIPQETLAQEWLRVTGDSSNVHVSHIENAERAVREVTRYVATPISSKIVHQTDKLIELMRATTGRHLCASFGAWRAWKVTAKPRPDPTIEWIDAGPLADWIRRAREGEIHAKTVLQHLTSRELPANGPPLELFR